MFQGREEGPRDVMLNRPPKVVLIRLVPDHMVGNPKLFLMRSELKGGNRCSKTQGRNITHYQRNANQNHNEVPLHASQNGCYPKVYKH